MIACAASAEAVMDAAVVITVTAASIAVIDLFIVFDAFLVFIITGSSLLVVIVCLVRSLCCD